MTNIEDLKSLGLSLQESRIYLALLEIGPSKVNDLLKNTHINRTHIYDCLEKLIGKGLASSMTRNGKKIFYAARPDAFNAFMEKKDAELEKQKSSVKSLIQDLEKISLNKVDESIEVYEGKDGLKSVLEDILRTKSDVLTYGSEGNFTKFLQYYFKHYLKRLEQNKIRMKVIFNEDDRKHILKLGFASVRYIPKEYATPTEITIYSDKVAIFIFSDMPKVVLIKSKTASDSYRIYFNLMWNIAKSSRKI